MQKARSKKVAPRSSRSPAHVHHGLLNDFSLAYVIGSRRTVANRKSLLRVLPFSMGMR
jgi:hypothetical protein